MNWKALRNAPVVVLIAAMLVAGCSESKLPAATGKASLRAINAVVTAPEVSFLIEERFLHSVAYRQLSSSSRFDDLSYSFNFDVRYAGETESQRIASTFVEVVPDLDYVFVLAGSLADASILVWETVSRDFADSDTVFEARFAHTAPSLGDVDYYFAPADVEPAAGAAIATLSFGELSAPLDFEEGEFVLTITASGEPGQVLFRSTKTDFSAATQVIVMSMEGGATTYAPYVARAITTGINSAGAAVTMPDADYRTVSEFVNGSLELGTVDIYEDELLTRQIVAGHAYKQVSDEINIANGGSTVWYTPATLLAPVLLEDEVSFFRGTRGRAVAYGAGDDIELRNYAPDRRPVETAAKLQLFNAAVNFGFIDIYVVESGESIEDALFPTSRLFPTGTVADTITLVAGEYDIYITEFDQEEILEGPIPIDVEIGDVLGGIVFDTVDPAILELILLPDNP